MSDPSQITTLEQFYATYAGNVLAFMPDDATVEDLHWHIETDTPIDYAMGANGEHVRDGDYALRGETREDVAEVGAMIKQIANEVGFDLTQLDDVRAAAAWDGNPSDISDMELGSLMVGYGLEPSTVAFSDGASTTLSNIFYLSADPAPDYENAMSIALGEQVFGDNNGNPNGVGSHNTALIEAGNLEYMRTGMDAIERERCGGNGDAFIQSPPAPPTCG